VLAMTGSTCKGGQTKAGRKDKIGTWRQTKGPGSLKSTVRSTLRGKAEAEARRRLEALLSPSLHVLQLVILARFYDMKYLAF
jgi:hypothetical protein